MPAPYKWPARYYDGVFWVRTAPVRSAAQQQILGPILPRVESACDLACGTGTTALLLARRGIRMFAVDLSPEMCRITREKSPRACVPIRVLRADAVDSGWRTRCTWSRANSTL